MIKSSFRGMASVGQQGFAGLVCGDMHYPLHYPEVPMITQYYPVTLSISMYQPMDISQHVHLHTAASNALLAAEAPAESPQASTAPSPQQPQAHAAGRHASRARRLCLNWKRPTL